ncbi:MAG: hypothetical protein IJD43_10145 [Thermoguttaceae bacterium]|nr:hypothetical protein [Thermoguttaceae bacterium]
MQEVHDLHEDEFLIVSLCPDHFLMDAFQEFLGISADLAFRAVQEDRGDDICGREAIMPRLAKRHGDHDAGVAFGEIPVVQDAPFVDRQVEIAQQKVVLGGGASRVAFLKNAANLGVSVFKSRG